MDEILLRKILETPSSTPKCMLYLETGCKPIRFIIQARRVNFLHYILKEDKSSLISRIFHAQNAQPGKNDWAVMILKDLQELEIRLSFEEIRTKSKATFKSLVERASSKRALSFLLEEKNKMRKVSHISICELVVQKYLFSQVKNLRIAKFIFHIRTRMLNIKANYGKKEPCPVCQNPTAIDM